MSEEEIKTLAADQANWVEQIDAATKNFLTILLHPHTTQQFQHKAKQDVEWLKQWAIDLVMKQNKDQRERAERHAHRSAGREVKLGNFLSDHP